MKRAICLLVAIVLILLSGAFAAVSDVDIGFVEGNEVVPPVDPEDPSIPLGPTEPGGEPEEGTGESGPLTINYVSPIRFGNQKLSTLRQTYKSETIRPFIQVTDLRGAADGWRVEARCDEFISGSNVLRGASLTLKGGSPLSVGDSPPPIPEALITLPADGITIAPIVFAPGGTGRGTWVTRWFPSGGVGVSENDNVTLTVLPSTAIIGAYKAIINWTLISAP